MPTPGGLPKAGEVWKLTTKLPPDWKPNVTTVVVTERGRGDYWPLRVRHVDGRAALWVNASYHWRKGELVYVGPAGPKTKKRLGLA